MSVESKARDTTIYDFCPDGVVATDSDHNVIAVNSAFVELFGYTIEELRGTSAEILYADPADFRNFSDHYSDATLGKAIKARPIRYRRKDGSIFTAETSSQMIYDSLLGQKVCIATVRDISRRVRTNDLLRSVVALTSDPGADTGVVVENFLRAGCDYFELDSGLVTERTLDNLTIRYVIEPKDGYREEDSKPIDETFCSTVIEAGEVRSFFHASKQEIADHACFRIQGFESYIGAPLTVSGKPYGTLSFCGHRPRSTPFTAEDETLIAFLADWLGGFLEQRQQQAALESLSKKLGQSADNFRKFYRKTPAMLHSITRDRKILFVSDLWLESMGYDGPDDVVGRDILEFIAPEEREMVSQSIDEHWGASLISNMPRKFVRKDGTIIEAEMSALHNIRLGDGLECTLAVTMDVTERNRARRALEKQNTTLERLNEELDAFASLASHDLQEPLRKIRKFSEILDEELGDKVSGDSEFALHAIQSAAERMQGLIGDLLEYSRTANMALAKNCVGLEDIVSQACDDLSVAISEANAKITVKSLPSITGDPAQVQLLFQNLIENAVKYRAPRRACRITVSARLRKAENAWHISVADNGDGFDPKRAQEIFLPFRRLQPQSESQGSGLGLAICAKVAERHRWSIRCKPKPGKGATFTLVVPEDCIEPKRAR
jgi:PAS domain S-box-containing protein